MNNGRVVVVYTSVEFSFCMLKTPRHYLSAMLNNYSKSLGYVSESAWRSVSFENVIRLLLGCTTVPVKIVVLDCATATCNCCKRERRRVKKAKKRQSLEANFWEKMVANFVNSFTCRLSSNKISHHTSNRVATLPCGILVLEKQQQPETYIVINDISQGKVAT